MAPCEAEECKEERERLTARVHALTERVQELRDQRETAQARANKFGLQYDEQARAARQAEAQVATLQAALAREQAAFREERERLLMRQGAMLDQLDRILSREGLRARDPALRCGAQQTDRCVLLVKHGDLHDDGCGTRWGEINGQREPAAPKQDVRPPE